MAGTQKTRYLWTAALALFFVAELIGFLVLLAWWLVLLGHASWLVWAGMAVIVLIGVMAVRVFWRHRFRFDLRMMLVFVTLVGLLSWWLAPYLTERLHDQRIGRARAIVAKYSPRMSGSGSEEFPPIFFDLDFRGLPLTDDELAQLVSYPGLTGLTLRGTRVSDQGMACLLQIPKLCKIDVSETSVSAKGIDELNHIPSLSILTLDAGQLRQLAGVPDDVLPQVHQLLLDNRGIDDQALADLARWKKLDNMLVCRASITDDGLALLGRLTQLTHLHVEGCAGVTDAGLQHLRKLHRLKQLHLINTSATEAGAAKLHESLPNCLIIVGQRGGKFRQFEPRETKVSDHRQSRSHEEGP